MNFKSFENFNDYKKIYEFSIENSDAFWSEVSSLFHWNVEPNDHKFEFNFNPLKSKVFFRYLSETNTNICYNALDRVIGNGFGEVIAYQWFVLMSPFLLR